MRADEGFGVPQLVKYAPGQKYTPHTDYWPSHQVMRDGSARLHNRPVSFFVVLKAECEGGETWFPRVRSSRNRVDVDEEGDGKEEGLKFKPVAGNAIFWVNLDEDGRGDERVVHAGLEVQSGEKVGLNIWPRRFYGWEDEREENGAKERRGWSGKWKE
jgi:prolyl 4-hydroxylase